MTAERPYRLGLTGSVGMGKSTTAGFFREAGVPVWDADAAVHRLYAAGGAGAAAIADLVPDAISGGAVNRARLRDAVAANPELLALIEARVHPLVAADRAAFLQEGARDAVVVLDIPLLYEADAGEGLDGVLVVTAPASVQRARVLARPGMTEAMLERILARQMPDGEKRGRADFVIETGGGIDAARAAVLSLLERIRAERRHA